MEAIRESLTIVRIKRPNVPQFDNTKWEVTSEVSVYDKACQVIKYADGRARLIKSTDDNQIELDVNLESVEDAEHFIFVYSKLLSKLKKDTHV